LGVMFAIVAFIAMLVAGIMWIRKRRRVLDMNSFSLWKNWKARASANDARAKTADGDTAQGSTGTWRDLESQEVANPGILKKSPNKLDPNGPIELDAQNLDYGTDCYSWTCKICSHAHNGPGDANCVTCGRERGREPLRKHKSVDELLASVVDKLEGRPELSEEVLRRSISSRNSLRGSSIQEGHSNWDGKLVTGPHEEWPPKKKPLQPIQVSGSRRTSQNGTPVGAQTPQGPQPGTVRLSDAPTGNDSLNGTLRQAGRATPSPMAKANGDRSGMALAASLGWGRGNSDGEVSPKHRRQSEKLPEVGTIVVLCNLESYPTWNGAEGEVVEVNHNKNNLCVLLEDGHERTVRPSQCRPKRESLREVQQSKKEESNSGPPPHPLGQCMSGDCFYSNRRGAWDICYHCEGRLSQAVAKASRAGAKLKLTDGPRMSTPPRPTTPPGGPSSRQLMLEDGNPATSPHQKRRASSEAPPKRRRSKEALWIADQPPPMPSPPKHWQDQLAQHEQLQPARQRSLPATAATGLKGSLAQKQAQLSSSMAKLKASFGASP